MEADGVKLVDFMEDYLWPPAYQQDWTQGPVAVPKNNRFIEVYDKCDGFGCGNNCPDLYPTIPDPDWEPTASFSMVGADNMDAETMRRVRQKAVAWKEEQVARRAAQAKKEGAP